MNIKEQIESGLYSKDAKGRALVPVSGNWVATICATDGPKGAEIIGFGPVSAVQWDVNGLPRTLAIDPSLCTLLPAKTPEDILRTERAKLVADFIGYKWDGLPEKSALFTWVHNGGGTRNYQGGKESIYNLVNDIMNMGKKDD